ncbi:hypothetical protein OROGR_030357 [Orobanche gracilis]
MVLLCFLLDLRSLSPLILRDLKQSLLQLANYYAVSSLMLNSSVCGTQSSSKPLLDRIGICYVLRNQISCSDELKIAYNPHGNFNLHNLHHALNNLPTDAFSPEANDSGALCRVIDLKLADVLSEEIIYAWGGHDKNIARKVIAISCCLAGTLDSLTMKSLMVGQIFICLFTSPALTFIVDYKLWGVYSQDAADKNISVEFIFLEKTSNHLGDITDDINHLEKQISSLKHCSFQIHVPGCFTCRCHGIPLDHSTMKPKRSSSCPVTNDDLGDFDINENSVRVGEQTILYMPSFQGTSKPNQVSSSIYFNVIQRTNLRSLSEGLIMGASYFVTPSAFHYSDESKSELNSQLFQVVSNVLNSLDQGLVCSSTCNIETGMETSFKCYYILLPSYKGLMLLRRLSALEEFLPIPNVSQLISSVVVEEITNTVQASLLKIEASDYNPFHHERGFHKKLNLRVKESLQFGAILPKGKGNSELDLDSDSPMDQPSVVTENELPQRDIIKPAENNKTSSSLSEEWEKLIVNELGVIMPSPTCNPSSKLDQRATPPPSLYNNSNNRQLDEKTSRILERLEIPRQLKRNAVSPTISSSPADVCGPAKKPLIPYKATDVVPISSSQPLKPSFHRAKRMR